MGSCLSCSSVDDVTIWWQMFNFVFLSVKRWFQFNSRIVRAHFASVMTFTETRSYISRWRSLCRRRRVCVNSLISGEVSHWRETNVFITWWTVLNHPVPAGVFSWAVYISEYVLVCGLTFPPFSNFPPHSTWSVFAVGWREVCEGTSSLSGCTVVLQTCLEELL